MKKVLTIAAALLVAMSAFAAQPKQHAVAIVAHRGHWNSAIGGGGTNTIASLKAAQKDGYWASEFDVNMTLDRELVVFHDGEVNGMPFIQHNWEEFKDVRVENGEPIPTLDQYLEQAAKHKKTRLVFEFKWQPDSVLEEFTDLCIAKLQKYGLYDPKQVIFISFNPKQCELLAKKCPGFTVQYLHHNMTPNDVYAMGVNGIDMLFTQLRSHQEWYDMARANGMSVNTWTVDNVKDMKQMIEMGVDQLTTNNPEKARELLKLMGIKELKAGKNE